MKAIDGFLLVDSSKLLEVGPGGYYGLESRLGIRGRRKCATSEELSQRSSQTGSKDDANILQTVWNSPGLEHSRS